MKLLKFKSLNRQFIFNAIALTFGCLFILLASQYNSSNTTWSSSCSDFNGNQGACQATTGCTWPYPGGTGSCNDFAGNQSACQSATGCSYTGTGGSCSTYNGNQTGCTNQSGCSYPGNLGSCSAFNGNQTGCTNQFGCSYPANAGNCSGLDSSTCTITSGCTPNFTSCSGFSDEMSCGNASGCSWNSGMSYCDGIYFTSCTGVYDDGSCIGNYDDGSCTGTYDDGSCTGSYDPNVCVGTYDNVAPTVLSAEVNGDTLTITFDELLDEGSVPSPASLDVDENSSNVSIYSINVSGSDVIITLNNEISYGSVVVVSYIYQSGPPIQDDSGNDLLNFSNQSVTNNTPDLAPTILSINSNSTNGAYIAGQVIDIDFEFSEVVTSIGDVTVTFETGFIDRTCTFSVSNSTNATCDYAIQPGDETSDLNVISVSGTINDSTLNPMVNFVPLANLATNKQIVIEIDETAPTITSITSDKTNGTYGVGEVIDIDVIFSEAVTSIGNVTVTLETGAIDRTCTFSVSNNSTSTCNYTVEAGDETSDLNVINISGDISDFSSNSMVNFVPVTNLSTNKNIEIDTSWLVRISAGLRNWYGLAASSDGTKLVAVVSGGYIYTSTDSGATWTERLSSGSNSWTDITSSADGTKLAVSAQSSTVYTSTNSGATWLQRAGSGFRNWSSITSSSDGTKLAAVVNGGYIYTSSDSGSTWTERLSAGSRSWRSITSSSDGTKLVAVNYGGYIYTSSDSGATWAEQTELGSNNWTSITSSADGVNIVAGTLGGPIYKSTDSGVNWTPQFSAGQRYWEGLSISSDGSKIAASVRNGGYIYTYEESPPDTTPPSISSPLPSGTQAQGTTAVTLQVTTNENATCKYGNIANTAYASISNTFNTTGGTTHTQSITGLAPNTTYAYYVRCSDGASNVNSSDTAISFSIPEEEQTSGGSGGTNIDISAKCTVSDTAIKVGEEIDVKVDINEVSKSGKDLDYTFRWTRVLSGSDTNTSISFDKPGIYTPRGQIKTEYKDQNISCKTITVIENEDLFVTTTSTPPQKEPSKYIFTKDLFFLMNDPEVKLLQEFLNDRGFEVATFGPGSFGNETTFFGNATRAALVRFQQVNNIVPSVGYFGPITRGFVNNQ